MCVFLLMSVALFWSHVLSVSHWAANFQLAAKKKNKAKKPQSTSESFWGEVGEHVSMWHFCVSACVTADLVYLPLASSHRHCCAKSIECILCALLIVHPFIATVFHHYHQCCCCFHSILISAVFFVHFRAVLNRHQIKLCAHFFNCHS